MTETESQTLERVNSKPGVLISTRQKGMQFANLILLTASIWLWLVPLRSPLWLDETISYWQIHSGFAGISSRQGLSFAAYSYILWFCTELLGTSEVGLRIPSVLAMLGAVYLLYRAACRLFHSNIAMLAVILFCMNPIVVFAAIDARSYAFGALAICTSIYLLVRLRESDSLGMAVGFGAVSATIVWFHFLFAVVIPALLAGFIIVKLGGSASDVPTHVREHRRKIIARQLVAATAGFAIAFLPTIPGLLYMFRTQSDHPFDAAPELGDLIFTIAPGWTLPVLAATALLGLMLAGLTLKKVEPQRSKVELWQIVLCQVLALVPLLILFGVSVATPLHIFVMRYRLVGCAAVSLCWALLVSGFKPRALQAVFCLGIVAIPACQYFRSPEARQHGYSWKYAIEAAQRNSSQDNAPVLMCSDLPESDHWALPTGDAVKDSSLFAPLSYYKLSSRVVALPRSLNENTKAIGSRFVAEATSRHERFLAIAFRASYPTLGWLRRSASGTYDVHEIGVYDGVAVVEFVPRGK